MWLQSWLFANWWCLWLCYLIKRLVVMIPDLLWWYPSASVKSVRLLVFVQSAKLTTFTRSASWWGVVAGVVFGDVLVCNSNPVPCGRYSSALASCRGRRLTPRCLLLSTNSSPKIWVDVHNAMVSTNAIIPCITCLKTLSSVTWVEILSAVVNR